MFGISRQWYYRSGWREDNRRETSSKVVSLVSEARRQLPRLGTRKLYHILREPLSELGVGRDKLFTILRANQMLVSPIKNYKVTTNSKHMFRKHKNLITDTAPVMPEQVWVSDITYIGKRNRHQYLSLITDAYSKKIVGYDLSDSLDAEGCIRALKMAVKNRVYKERELIHHSDRGIQYCCADYQKQINNYRLRCSMTESYDPYANAIAERVNGILKQEFLFAHTAEKLPLMQTIVKQSIEKYNSLRPHLSCNMLTPNQMHKQSKIKIKSYSKKLSPRVPLGINKMFLT